ncbi:hypothetical protein [Rummeliibacillus pycnus]|uniref:hypothetical protein n=1 Tax=Rummeliibacillus pycnus TaxID=101070 RepID=UPI003D2C3CCD
MGNKKIPFKKNYVAISQQIIAMKNTFPGFKEEWDKNTVIWTGHLKPTALSKNYTVRIAYSLNMIQPQVTVLSPKLVKRGEESIPHVYPGNKLCLFRPKRKEWTKEMLISETIVPWASLWLYYYELWHTTGEWLGGGEHPNKKKRKNYF